MNPTTPPPSSWNFFKLKQKSSSKGNPLPFPQAEKFLKKYGIRQTPPPFLKNVQTWREQNSSLKRLNSEMTPPPLRKNSKRKQIFFWMASLSNNLEHIRITQNQIEHKIGVRHTPLPLHLYVLSTLTLKCKGSSVVKRTYWSVSGKIKFNLFVGDMEMQFNLPVSNEVKCICQGTQRWKVILFLDKHKTKFSWVSKVKP